MPLRLTNVCDNSVELIMLPPTHSCGLVGLFGPGVNSRLDGSFGSNDDRRDSVAAESRC